MQQFYLRTTPLVLKDPRRCNDLLPRLRRLFGG